MSGFKVNRCICQRLSFEEIKKYAREHELTSVKQLQANEICSTKCHMCVPYIEMVLETGETEFEPGAYIGRKKSI